MLKQAVILTAIAVAFLQSGCSTTADDAEASVIQPEEQPVTPQAETSTTPVDVLGSFEVVFREGSDLSGVANITCATGEILVGGGCACIGDPSLDEGGFLFACATNGTSNGYAGGCYDFVASQASNEVLVRIQCAKTTTKSVVQAAPSMSPTEDATYQSIKARATAYRAKLNK